MIFSQLAAEAQNALPEFVLGLRAAAQHIARLGQTTAGGSVRAEAPAPGRSSALLPLEGWGAGSGDSASCSQAVTALRLPECHTPPGPSLCDVHEPALRTRHGDSSSSHQQRVRGECGGQSEATHGRRRSKPQMDQMMVSRRTCLPKSKWRGFDAQSSSARRPRQSPSGCPNSASSHPAKRLCSCRGCL